MYAIELNGLHCGLAVSYTDKYKKLKVVVADQIKHTGKTVSLITKTKDRYGYWHQSTHNVDLNTEVHVHDDYTATVIKQGATV